MPAYCFNNHSLHVPAIVHQSSMRRRNEVTVGCLCGSSHLLHVPVMMIEWTWSLQAAQQRRMQRLELRRAFVAQALSAVKAINASTEADRRASFEQQP